MLATIFATVSANKQIDSLIRLVAPLGARGARAFALASLGLLTSTVYAQTTVSGSITTNKNWALAGSPYIVSGNVLVQNNAVLTIEKGVDVQMAAGASLTVATGSIRAAGTAAAPILVYSQRAAQGQPGDWKQWTFTAGAVDTRLDYVNFEHGSGLEVNGAAAIFNFVNIRKQLGAAITIDLAASLSGIGNSANDNTLNGIAVPAGEISGSVRWSLRGIPFVVQAGVVSVGAAPVISSMTPNTVQAGQSATVVVSGSRLAGLTNARFEQAGLSAEVLQGGTNSQASILVTSQANAATGGAPLRVSTDAGELRVVDLFSVQQSQPSVVSLTPASIFSGQGNIDVVVNGQALRSDSVVLVNGQVATTQFVSSTQLRASFVAPTSTTSVPVRVRTPDTLNAGQYLLSNEVPLPVLAAQLLLTPNSTTAIAGSSTTFTLTVPYPAPAGGIVVALSSSAPAFATLPGAVTVLQGQTSVTFNLAGVAAGNTVLTASATGFASANAAVNVILPPTLTFNPASLSVGLSRTGQFVLQSSNPAGATGIEVALQSSAASIATVPASVTIAPGANTASVPVTTVALGNATITAQSNGFALASGPVTVRTMSLAMPATALVSPGLSRPITVLLSDPAPAGGLTMTLVSSNEAVATVPVSVTVAAGETSTSFLSTGVAAGTARITAAATNYQSAATDLTVGVVTIGLGSPPVSTLTVPVDNKVSVAVTLSRVAPAGGVVVDLSMTNPALATVTPSQVLIPEGQTSSGAILATVTGVAKGTTTFKATSAGMNAASVSLTVAGKPVFIFGGSPIVVGKRMKSHVNEFNLRRMVDNADYAPNEAVTVQVSNSLPGKVSAPTEVTIPAGASTVVFSVAGLDLTNGTPALLNAEATGYVAAASPLSVSVVTPVITFLSLPATQGVNSPRSSFQVSISTPGARNRQVAASPWAVALSAVEANPANIVDGFYTGNGTKTDSVTINTDAYDSVSVNLASPTATGSYKVQASLADVATATSPVISVIAPALGFSKPSVVVGKGFRTYYLELSVGRRVGNADYNPDEALTVNLTSSNPQQVSVPATVVIPAKASGATVIVSGLEVTGNTPATITATAVGHSQGVVDATVILPVYSLEGVEPVRATSSPRDDIFVGISIPGSQWGPAGGAVADMALDLSIVAANPAGIINGIYSAASAGTPVTQAVIRANNNASDYFYIGTPTIAGSYKLQAAVPGGSNLVSPLVTVTGPALTLSSNSGNVGKGFITNNGDFVVKRVLNGTEFNGTAPVTVTLTSSAPDKLSVPATVTIPSNSYYAYFRVTGVDVTGATPVTINASANGYAAPATPKSLNVVLPQLWLWDVQAQSSQVSARDGFSVGVGSVPGTLANDMLVDMSIVDADPAGIVDGFYLAQTGGSTLTQLRIPAGDTGVAAFIGTPNTSGSYKIRAAHPNALPVTSGVVTSSMPELRFTKTSMMAGKGLRTAPQEISVQRLAGGAALNGASALVVNLKCNAAVLCSVPATVTIPANSSSATFAVDGLGVGSTTITATAAGYASGPDLAVNVIVPTLNYWNLQASTAKGTSKVLEIFLWTNGNSYQPTAIAPLDVNLVSSATNILTVPALATIPAGSGGVHSSYQGVAPGTATVTVSGAGMVSTTSSTITVTP